MLLGQPLHPSKPPIETRIGFFQRRPGIAAQLSRQVDHGEEEIANLGLDPIGIGVVGQLGIQFVQFFRDLVAGTLGILPVEADTRRALL